jgi:hypothetical protein
MVQGSGFRVQCPELRVQGLGFIGLEFRGYRIYTIRGNGFRAEGLCSRVGGL